MRFYSTVLDWDYIEAMREDLIERLTSKIFEKHEFSSLILQLCRETSRGKEKQYLEAIDKLSNVKPKDVGISLYFTCDESSKLEQVFLELHPDVNLGDSGSSSDKTNRADQHHSGSTVNHQHYSGQNQTLVPITEVTEDETMILPRLSDTPHM